MPSVVLRSTRVATLAAGYCGFARIAVGIQRAADIPRWIEGESCRRTLKRSFS